MENAGVYLEPTNVKPKIDKEMAIKIANGDPSPTKFDNGMTMTVEYHSVTLKGKGMLEKKVPAAYIICTKTPVAANESCTIVDALTGERIDRGFGYVDRAKPFNKE